MAINPFFDLYEQDAEQQLWNDLVIESIKQIGEDVQYIPRNLVNFDRLLGADDSSRFDDTYTIEMQTINIMGFTGDKEFYSQFGHQVRDELTLSVSKERWISEVGIFEDMQTPQQGDLIWHRRYNKLFVIKFVDPREAFYQLGKLYTWELICEVFEYSGEEIDTGLEEIDIISERSTNVVDWALTDENGLILTDEDGNVLVVDEYELQTIQPGSTNDYIGPELERIANNDISTHDPFGFLSSQSQ
jgi:hypothetical protein